MAKHAAVQFARQLRTLFDHSAFKLIALVRPRPGKRPAFGRRKIERVIGRLQDLAVKCRFRELVDRGMPPLYVRRIAWNVRSPVGRGPLAKRRAFEEWFESTVKASYCIYVFWAGRRCRYVGRSSNGGHRPKSHFEKHWMSGVTRVVIYECAGSRNLPQLECLATHRFDPSHSRVRPAAQRYRAKCPVCTLRRKVRREAKRIFRLR